MASSSLRIAIVHYHLRTGGVTRIIEHTLAALEDKEVTLGVLTGEAPPDHWPGSWCLVEGLGYEEFRQPWSAEVLAEHLETSGRRLLGGPVDLWHIHNHSLGKNLALPGALRILAQKGSPLLLHIHDFAEDGRPGNYRRMCHALGNDQCGPLARLLYPQGDHIHYAVLNPRDYHFLGQAGLDPACLHLLPNPVQLVFSPDEDVAVQQPPLWLYPTRGIRRKNLGEFLLWATLMGKGHCFATTSLPLNPKEKRIHDRWQQVARELALPLCFGITRLPGNRCDRLMRTAHGLVTTSVAEGFGLAFLEPWLAGRPVCGRDLPEITASFVEEGLRFPWLYERCEVPVSWIGLSVLMQKARKGLQRNLAAYGRYPDAADLERLLASWVHDNRVDFGRLDEDLQEKVLHKLKAQPEAGLLVRPASLPAMDREEQIVAHNQQIIRRSYSLTEYGKKLMALYQRVLASPLSPLCHLDGNILLDLFLAPERLSLLRVD